MAGYSGTPLVKKLGIKPGFCIYFLNAPEQYQALLGELPPDVNEVDTADVALDFIQFFTKSAAALVEQLPVLMKALKPNGMLWVSWPKKAAKIPTDLTEDVIREIGLAAGLVDVKVIAVDEVWSGLKFVYRLQDRPAKR